MRATIWAAILTCVFAAPIYSQQGTPSAIPVGTIIAERKPISKALDFVGRVEAINRVEIRARVKGYLEAILFKEGDLVKEGDPLYRIEKDLFKAAVEQAQGTLQSSKAQYELAVKNRERQAELRAKNVSAGMALDEAVGSEGRAKGAVMTSEANLATAQINLRYTEITAPIAGKVGRTAVTKGNVVGPDSGVLTTIVSQDPMYVTFPVSQREFLQAQSGQPTDVKNIKVQIRFSDGSVYNQLGEINFVDVTVDRTTDTVIARATMPNPNGRLIDGQLVRVNLESGTPEEKVVIPQAALIADQGGVYVFVVEDGKAVIKRVKPGAESGTNVVIDAGLSGGEQVIVEGLQGIRAGIAVRASPIPQALRG
ncbi:MAG: efflux transporter periplasmic adaptor subunit [Alphaproteobacteria bacterium 13_2_20CM_2_64_7]|jgi:membrane fusion protein (multidrug efflux system)|nr:MAG: efflux transporter periplasmic adaptor subunit [Alphaproteobacteria bacterium 13_2_20CM_2_64_7]